MKNKRRPVASLIAGMLTIGGVGFTFAVPLITAPAPAAAASGSCSNYAVGGAINAWFWNPPTAANGWVGNVGFSAGGANGGAIGPYPASVNKVDQNWKQIDDTAPILWGYKSGVVGGYQELFTSCQQWTLQAAQAMANQGFSPTMIGGVMGPVIGPNGTVVPDPVSSGSSATSTQKMETITVNASPVNYYVGGKLATPTNGMFNNQDVVTVSDSFVYDKTTFVPIRFAAELLGQPVAWSSSQYGVNITANSSATPPPSSTTMLRAPLKPDTMQITVNATPMHFYVGGANRTPAGAVFNNQGVTTLDGFVYDKTTYVPIRLAAELLGQTIQWNSNRYSVDIGTPPTSTSIGQATETTGTVANTTALSYPPVVTNPPAGSATRAANGIKQDDKLFAAGKATTSSKASPAKAVVAILVLVALVVGVVFFIRWRRRRNMYDLHRSM